MGPRGFNREGKRGEEEGAGNRGWTGGPGMRRETTDANKGKAPAVGFFFIRVNSRPFAVKF